MPGVWDALSVRLAAEAGFDTVFLSGYCVSGTQLGLPDFGYLTQPEMAEVARRVCAASTETMVIVDGDTGYGNPLNVIRTVEMWEAAGATGIFLEDQVWPKRCGHMAGKQVVPADEWLAKLRAAVDHRTHLHVTARTDARAAIGLDEAISRARGRGRRRCRRGVRRGARVDRRARADRRGAARSRARREHGRDRQDAVAHARRAARSRVRPHRVAAVGVVLGDEGAARHARHAAGQGHAARRPRSARRVRRRSGRSSSSTATSPSTRSTGRSPRWFSWRSGSLTPVAPENRLA